MGLRLKNDYGILQIEPSNPKVSQTIRDAIDTVTDACLICNNATLEDDSGKSLDYDGKPLFFENQNIHFTFDPSEDKNHDFILSIRGIEEGRSKKLNDRSLLAKTIRFSNAVGFTDIAVRNVTRQKDIINFRAEIFPQKIDYKNDFSVMLHELTEIIYSLAIDYFKKTYFPTEKIDTSEQTLSQWLVILKHLFDSLIRHIDLVLKRLHYKVHTSTVLKDVSNVRRLDKKPTKWILKNQKYINTHDTGFKIGDGLSITHLPESKKRLSHDTFENRFLVWAIKQIIMKINEISSHITKIYADSTGTLPAEAQNELALLNLYRSRLLGRLNDQYLQNISDFDSQLHFSTVLTMAPGYKDFYMRFLLLRKGLSISAAHLFNLDLKDISLLYEYWCFLKILKLLKSDKDKYELKDNDFIKLEHDRFVVKLQKGEKSRVSFTKKDTGGKINVFYNKAFNPSDYITFRQIPDSFIEFKKKGYENPFWYIFDAKYRFDNGIDQGYRETTVPNGPPQDTIGQMHRYRDAILSVKAKDTSYSSAIKSLGGIILFPFPGKEEDFKTHPFYKSIEKVNIGAIPLHPGRENKLFKEFLDDLFAKTPETIYETIIDYDKSDYKAFVDDINTIVLIGLMKERDSESRVSFHIKKKLYHTWFDKKYDIETTDKKIFKTKYVALYSQEKRQIIGYANVDNISYKTADELKTLGVSWHLSQDEYLVFSLKDIDSCNLKFSGANLRRGKFYTNYFCFKEFLSERVDETFLKLDNYEIIRLWKEVKNLDPNCEYTKSNQKLSFTFENREWECIQDKDVKPLFYINKNKYYLTQNLKEFLLKAIL